MVARRLAHVRKTRGLTQEQLAALTGAGGHRAITSSTVRRIEHGHVARPETIRRLAQVLGVDELDLYGLAERVDDEDAEPALA
jgi:transcriptional regulator with XRE-family HTH domain